MLRLDQRRLSSNIVKWVLLVMLSAILTGCFGLGKSKKPTTDAAGEPIVDMTLPPSTIKGGPAIGEDESNPDETVSFEAWQKQQEKPKE